WFVPVLCSKRENRSPSRRLQSGSRSARKGSRERNGSKAWRLVLETSKLPNSARDRRFESISLQQRVINEPVRRPQIAVDLWGCGRSPRLRVWPVVLPLCVLWGGVLRHSMKVLITATLLPSIVAELGGANLMSWPTTAFVASSIIAASGTGLVSG